MEWRYPWIFTFFLIWILVSIIISWKENRSTFFFNQISGDLKNHLFTRTLWNRIILRKRLILSGILFLIIAAAGPQIGTRVKPVERKGVDLVFAIDVSISMDAIDVKPSRLDKAKFEIGRLINELKGVPLKSVKIPDTFRRIGRKPVKIPDSAPGQARAGSCLSFNILAVEPLD